MANTIPREVLLCNEEFDAIPPTMNEIKYLYIENNKKAVCYSVKPRSLASMLALIVTFLTAGRVYQILKCNCIAPNNSATVLSTQPRVNLRR